MHLILLFFCTSILLIYPVLYPPIACLIALYFVNDRDIKLSYVPLFLIFSSAIVSSLISATILPASDTLVYIESFKNIQSFDFHELKWDDNDGFEPLYKIYEYFVSFFVHNNHKLFLLITSIIFNTISTVGILRICLRLNQAKLLCLIFATLYSLAPPAFGSAIFVLRSSLSLSILLLAISFYKQRQIYFYLFGIASILIHYGSLLLFAPLIFYNYWLYIRKTISSRRKEFLIINKKKSIELFMDRIEIFFLRFSFLILITTFLTLFVMPSLVQSVLQNFISSWLESGIFSNRGEALMMTGENKAVDLSNISMLTQVAISLLCFVKLQNNRFVRYDVDKFRNHKLRDYVNLSRSCNMYENSNRNLLDGLRFMGRWLITIVIITAPFDALPYRFGFFNFLYFPLWLINIPFLSLGLFGTKYSRNLLVLFSVVCVSACTFYWTPKREGVISNIVVLEGRALRYNLPKVIEYYID